MMVMTFKVVGWKCWLCLLGKTSWVKLVYLFPKYPVPVYYLHVFDFFPLSYCFVFLLNETLQLLYKYFAGDGVWLKLTLLKLTSLDFFIPSFLQLCQVGIESYRFRRWVHWSTNDFGTSSGRQSVGEGARFQSLYSLNHKAKPLLHENFDDSKASLLGTFFLRTEYNPQSDLALPSSPLPKKVGS